MVRIVKRLRKEESGQGLVEYGLILALVSVVAVGALNGVGDKVTSTFSSVNQELSEGMYSDEVVQSKIDEGYIPIATPDELASIGGHTIRTLGDSPIYGKGTRWEDNYNPDGLGGQYLLVSDIDLSGIDNWEPIGDINNSFMGDFDGGGYIINNLSIDRPDSNYVGLFGRMVKASIENVGLNGVIVSGYGRVGGLVGEQDHNSKIINSFVNGSVSGYEKRIGGLVGLSNHSSEIIHSYATGDVMGVMIDNPNADSGSRVGGLVGEQFNHSKVIYSYSNSDVSGRDLIGGLVGVHARNFIIENDYTLIRNSYSKGSVSGHDLVGGLVGYHSNGAYVDNSHSLSVVSGTGERVGGLIGWAMHPSSRLENSGWLADSNNRLDGVGSISDNVSIINIQGYSKLKLNDIIANLF